MTNFHLSHSPHLPIQPNGTVSIAGAGPGDASLITLKLLNRLENADVIICDRLVNSQILSYCNVKAVIENAGKQGYSNQSTSQEHINKLLVSHAIEGKKVLRLKGGDVSFFSNITDELKALLVHAIPYEIIPGISAAAGAAAYSGIPLTSRDVATAVHWITFNPASQLSLSHYAAALAMGETVVVYMAARNISSLAKALCKSNASLATIPLAVIEQATTPFQKVTTYSLEDMANIDKGNEFTSPSIVVIGKVVIFHEEFKWFNLEKINEHGSIFQNILD